MDEKDYISSRLEDQINWYDSKSISNQRYYKNLKTVEIICAAIIPFIAGFSDKIPFSEIIIGVLAIVIAIIAGISAINKFQENWLTYRTTAETLKHEKYLFLTKCKPYNDDNAFQFFVQRIEGLISKENSLWSRNAKKTENEKHN